MKMMERKAKAKREDTAGEALPMFLHFTGRSRHMPIQP